MILTCLALGGLLLAIRAGGAMVGWAFQLQDPRVILLLLLLVTAIALNLAGLFQLPMLAGGGGLARARRRRAAPSSPARSPPSSPRPAPARSWALRSVPH